MKGTEKQIAWAQDILDTQLPVWDAAYEAGLARLQQKLENAKAKGRERSIARNAADVEAAERANQIIRTLDNAAKIIENKNALSMAQIAHSTAPIEFMAVVSAVVGAFDE